MSTPAIGWVTVKSADVHPVAVAPAGWLARLVPDPAPAAAVQVTPETESATVVTYWGEAAELLTVKSTSWTALPGDMFVTELFWVVVSVARLAAVVLVAVPEPVVVQYA